MFITYTTYGSPKFKDAPRPWDIALSLEWSSHFKTWTLHRQEGSFEIPAPMAAWLLQARPWNCTGMSTNVIDRVLRHRNLSLLAA